MTDKMKRNTRKPIKNHLPPQTVYFNICGIRSNFWSLESFLWKRFSDIYAHYETNLNSSIVTHEFSDPERLCRIDLRIHMHGLRVYIP